jgi:hypothetical protein
MTLRNSVFWFFVGFISVCAVGIIVYARERQQVAKLTGGEGNPARTVGG